MHNFRDTIRKSFFNHIEITDPYVFNVNKFLNMNLTIKEQKKGVIPLNFVPQRFSDLLVWEQVASSYLSIELCICKN